MNINQGRKKMKIFCLEVIGDFACFTRPEMKVERVSYDVITPSAARAIYEAILWKPAVRWQVMKIEVLKPIKWITLRRNEVGAVVSSRNAQAAMNSGSGDLGLYIEDERQQRAGLFLRDVAYRIHAGFELLPNAGENNTSGKFLDMFERRASKGQCVNQPYLGCREFAAAFQLVDSPDALPAPIGESRDLGWMLYDMNYGNRASPNPRFFRAELKSGVLDLAKVEVRE
ncbi:type I-C CRISPR-associated protein Cas5c [Nitrosovibrio sp. Nv6]|uniref:type I-C CRISPR-associated protein Cas5c n=1 Tax=Nitrosovibrio sp. Nv6 TaxID=1855340 RepID=UPI0008ADB3EC|nr:type I-C CRISPR-associated protein Cas5c [Nitrosovibrio sp. Nv6]SEP18857.1 CRISPR-associated protein Cas5d [Nitrosovibrio sp. Nv6]